MWPYKISLIGQNNHCLRFPISRLSKLFRGQFFSGIVVKSGITPVMHFSTLVYFKGVIGQPLHSISTIFPEPTPLFLRILVTSQSIL